MKRVGIVPFETEDVLYTIVTGSMSKSYKLLDYIPGDKYAVSISHGMACPTTTTTCFVARVLVYHC